MSASIAEALAKALADQTTRETQQAQRPELTRVVQEWSEDDHVHVDPPIHREPEQEKQEPQMFNQQPPQPNGAATTTNTTTPAPEPLSVTKTTFEFVRDNPGLQRSDLVQLVAKQYGFKVGSVSSLIGQMIVQKMMYRDEEGRLYTNRREFTPLKSGAVREALKKAHWLELEKEHPRRFAGYVKMAKTRRDQAKARSQGEPEKEQIVRTSTQTANKTSVKDMQMRAAHAREVLAEKRLEAKRARAREYKRKHREIMKANQVERVQRTNAAEVVKTIDAMPTSYPPVNLRDLTPTQIVNALSIVQAHGVFKELTALLGRT